MKRPFTRETLVDCGYDVLERGRWGNADIYIVRHSGATWVIKDYMPCHPIIRKTWGRLMVAREYRALFTLRGIPGVPSAPFLLDHYALCYHFIPGSVLREVPAERIGSHFFPRLEQLVIAIHRKNLVHLDIRNQRNILMGEDGSPAILDFQSSMHLKKAPGFLHNLLKEIDLSGVYKLWDKNSPQTLGRTRKSRLEAINRKRFLWFLRGYPLGTRKNRRA
ncbi:MAG: hypothetical protein VR64_08330 [Desulfatitalea sp. BRH_c12]|nr:MAG: hypothetical protein VR64_08330 [Desulfatitalea sp. BRH_c12]